MAEGGCLDGETTAPYRYMLLGAHVDRGDVLAQAREMGAGVVQIFLSGPRTWRAPKTRGDEESLANSGLKIYVHAPYLVNPASLNPEVRLNSRRCIAEQAEAAGRINAAGLIVHGGHPTGAGTVSDGISNWVEVLDGLDLPVPLLIENTAGGRAAVARRFDAFARLYDALHDRGHDIGVCLDTCHAHAGGEDLETACDKLVSFAGKIDLVHANDSKDGFDSGRDRHENLGRGEIGIDRILAVVAAAKCPAVVETPGGTAMMQMDVENIRRALGA